MNTVQAGILVSAVAVAFAFQVQAQPPAGAKEDMGKHEYEAHCAVCHGETGKGDGPYLRLLGLQSVPDLTKLSERNSGVYPFERVYETIDGRRQIRAHGTSDMPIWGQRYNMEALGTYYEYPDAPSLPAWYVRARILALTEYLARIQTK
ncbi:MAG TPA: cytochrome c [Usitatibacter sp.]|nr:cytochrome c [Usitatibacter sp.]